MFGTVSVKNLIEKPKQNNNTRKKLNVQKMWVQWRGFALSQVQLCLSTSKAEVVTTRRFIDLSNAICCKLETEREDAVMAAKAVMAMAAKAVTAAATAMAAAPSGVDGGCFASDMPGGTEICI